MKKVYFYRLKVRRYTIRLWIRGWGMGRRLQLQFKTWLPWATGPQRLLNGREADWQRIENRSRSPLRSRPWSESRYSYGQVDSASKHVIKGTLGLFQDGLEVVEGHHGLLLDVIGDQFSGFGVDANLSREVHDSVEDFGCGVGSDGFGSQGGVEGLDEARHDIMANKDQISTMNQITIITILQKIRSISKDCGLEHIPEKIVPEFNRIEFEPYLRTLERIRLQFINYRSLEEEYFKLQNVLQKQETEIRKRIGAEQQLKLYTQTLKSQVEELEAEKLDLLDNSKTYIKELKKTNESLFAQLHLKTHFHKRNNSKSNSPMRTEKAKHNKSVSHSKATHDKSIKEIIKTEYIQRERSTSGKKKQHKKKGKLGGYSTISGNETDCRETSKTYQVVEGAKKDRPTTSKKKNKHVFSNFTLLNFLDSSHKKMKKEEKTGKSPGQGVRKKQGSRVQANSKSLWRDKKTNKSIFSVMSVDPNLHSNKQTI